MLTQALPEQHLADLFGGESDPNSRADTHAA